MQPRAAMRYGISASDVRSKAMLAQRFIALCDVPGCRARTRALVLFRMKPALHGMQHPIALAPVKVVLPEGWSWGWVSEKSATQIFCKRHRRRE
jgi:hypothetical protein